MKKFNFTAIATAIALSFSAGAIAAQGISRDEYKAGMDKIAADYKAANAGCSSKAGNAKDICVVEAKGREKVAKAELEARYKPGDKSDHAVSVAKAEADYSVAREKCDDKAGNDKQACVNEAKAAQARAKADARPKRQSANANKPAEGGTGTATTKGESAGAYIDDSVITGKIKADILAEPSLKSAEINVETLKGVVQLSGFVRSSANINKAVEVARGVKGVKSVKNDMIVKGQQ
jgi:osmotically-inducible protein OsmY